MSKGTYVHTGTREGITKYLVRWAMKAGEKPKQVKWGEEVEVKGRMCPINVVIQNPWGRLELVTMGGFVPPEAGNCEFISAEEAQLYYGIELRK